MAAIIRTLRHSSESGLNASLSPLDCRILLSVISTPKSKTAGILDRMTDTLSEMAESAMRDIADGIRKELE